MSRGTRRNVTSAGYVRLNQPDHPLAMADGWVFEHRLVAWETFGPFDTSMHVHHINGDKSDNRPDNLELLTPQEHGKEHATLDWPLAAEMYASGSPTTEIARTLGTHPGNVSRMLRSAGVTMRTPSEAKLMDDPSRDDVHRAAVGASSASDIADRLGVGVGTARRLMRQHGVPSFPAGRRRAAA